MASWNYRIIDFGTHRALHEVYYDAAGRPVSWTERPVTFVSDPEDGPDDIARMLEVALRDATERKALRPVEVRTPKRLAPSRTAAAWLLYGLSVVACRMDWGSLYQATMARSWRAQGGAHGPWSYPTPLVEID